MESTKIWLIADTHFGVKGDDDEWLNDYVGYFEDVVLPIMRKEVGENDILVHCGDVFDNRTTLGLNTITRVINLFDEFSKIFKDIRITVGNHDMAKKSSTEITSVNVLKHIPNVKIYYEPTVEVIAGKTCLFNPWIEDQDKEKEVLKDVDVDYIFGHLQVGGSKASDRGGVKIDITSGVSIADFKDAQVYAGHIHIRQDNKNVHYIGNPYHKDRGDRENDKGITVLDIRTNETQFIENTVTPRFLKESIYDILNMTVGDLKKRWNNNRIDLHLKGEDMIRCNFDDLKDALGNCYRSFNPQGDNTVTELNTDAELKFDDAKTAGDYMAEFLGMQDLTPEFRKRVEAKMEELMERI